MIMLILSVIYILNLCVIKSVIHYCLQILFDCFAFFFQRNSDGQTMLASTLIPQPYSMTHAPIEEDVRMSFGRFVYF
jgi:hypothetical protein